MRVGRHNIDLRMVTVVAIILFIAGVAMFGSIRATHAGSRAAEALQATVRENQDRIDAACRDYNRGAAAVDAKLKAIIATTGGGTALDQPTVDQITDPTVRAIFQRVLDNGQASRRLLLEAVGKPLPRQHCRAHG